MELAWPAPDSAPCRLVLCATRAPDYATLRFRVNGQPVVPCLDGYADAVQPAFPLGEFTPRNGQFNLRVEVYLT